MRKIYALLFASCFLFIANLNAQLSTTVTKSGTPIAGSPFANLSAAITAVNGLTIDGPVVVTCPSGTETAPSGGYSITATGTVTNTIIIQGNGASNTIITAPSPAGTAGNLHDAIFKIIGGDYITIQGFAMNENGSNTNTTAGTNTMVEWGVALLYASTTNGAQNCTIQNNSITLNRTYQNTWGIYSNSTHSATVITTTASATTSAGGNSGLKIYGNTITNVNQAICVVGPTAAADYNTGLDIGGASGATANTITNWGTTGSFSGYANVSGTLNCILVRNSTGYNISYNTLTSSVGGNTVTASQRAIFIPAFSIAPTGTFTNSINNNSISVQSGIATGTLNGIIVEATTGTATSTLNINNNNFHTFNHSVTGSGACTFISNAMAHLNSTINSNTFTNITLNTTGSVTFISNSVAKPAGGTQTANNNSIVTQFTKSGAGGTILFYNSNSTSPTTVTETNTGNNFSNLTFTAGSTISGWVSSDGSTTSPFGSGKTVTNNTFNNITNGGTSATTILNVGYSNAGSSTNNVSGNTISNISGGGNITALTSLAGGQNFFNNTIFGLTSSGSSSSVTGISISGATSNQNVYKNKIYDLISNGTTGLVSGVTISSGLNVNIYNNLIGNLTAPSSNNTTNDAVRGISITSSTTSSSINLFYNSIYLTGTSTAADFATSGIFHTYNATATTATLLLKNNIIVNACTAKGVGKTSALRRSAATDLNNFSTSSSNNLYFGSSIYHDGTNSDVTMGAYATRVGARATASFSENPTWVSTTGSSSNFLHIDATAPTQIEKGGTPISTPINITDDFDGDARDGVNPDVGADEGTFTQAIPMTYTSSTTEQVTGYAYAGATNQSIIRVQIVTTGATTPLSLTNLTLNANGTTAIGDINASTAKVYYTGSSTTFSTSQLFGSATPTIANFTVSGSQTLVEGNNYFWLAYDVASAATSGNFIDGECIDLTVGSVYTPTATAPAGNKTILGAMSGIYNIGASQTFPHFTNLTAAITDLNIRGINAAVTFALQNDYSSAGETFPLSINEFTGASNTLTIKPASGVTATISGSSSSSIFRLNGADYVIIDGSNSGGTDRSLTIENISTASSSSGVEIRSLGAGFGATDNTIKNCNIKTGTIASTTYCITINGGTSPTTAGHNSNNITIQNNALSKATYGINVRGTAGNEFTGLNITQNIIGSNTVTDYITDYGIYFTLCTGPLITNNEIYNLISNNSKYGIYAASTITNGIISKNKIHDFGYTNTTSYITNGIYFVSASHSNNQIDNNVIYNLSAHGSATATSSIAGIRVAGGTTFKIYFNSVSLTGAMVTANAVSSAFMVSTASTNMDIRNNSFYTVMTGTTPVNYAIYTVSSTTYTYINYNDYFSSSANQGYVGGSARIDLAAIQNATSQDANSISSNPLYNSTTNLIPASGSPLISAGDDNPQTGVTDDFLGNTRSDPPYIGAYELNGDFAGPTISFTALTNHTSLTSRATSSFATITDGSGVNTTVGTKPRIYYKKSTANNAFVGNTSGDNGWKFVEANNASSPFDFTIDYSKLVGGSVSVGDVIQYFVVAQDLAGTPNVGINGSLTFAGNTTPSTVDLQTSGVTSITGTPNSYTITPSISGTITVPGTYPSLTLTGGAFEAINNATVTGNINIEITGDLTSETGAISLNEFASPFTVKIYPTGAVRTVSGSLNSNALIKLNGADRVTIDGSIGGSGTDRSLTITNTATTAPTTISLISLGTGTGATDNTIKNCNISTGVQTSTGYGIAVGGSTPGTSGADNDNNTIQNNNITNCFTGIYAIGSGSVSTGGCDNINIIGNTLDYNSTLTGPIAIRVSNILNSFITQNSISYETTAVSCAGISLETGTNNTIVNRNLISKVKTTNNASINYTRGIVVGTGSATSAITISNNVIYGVLALGATSNVGGTHAGIMLGAIGVSSTVTTTTGGINLYYNSINLTGNSDRAIASISYGFFVGSGSSNINCINNVFVNSTINLQASNAKAYSIYSAAVNTAFTTINYNDYFVSGSQGVLGFIGSDRTDLTGIQAGFGQNVNSITSNPLFNSTTNLIPQIGSPLVNVGDNTTGVTTDYLGVTRTGNTTIGAYETAADANGPTITLASLGNTNLLTNRTTTSFATITDGSGVNTTGGTKPRIYYKKSTANNAFVGNTSGDNGWKYVEANNSSSPFDFTIDYSKLVGGSVTVGDVIQYFVVAQDLAGTPNVGINGSLTFAGNSTPATVDLQGSGVTSITGTPNSYNITTSISGTITVPGTYASLTLTGGAFEAINNATVTGNINIEIAGNLTSEDGTNALNEFDSPYTISIYPTGAARTISGSAAVFPTSLIKLNAADRVTIDGSIGGVGTDKSLTISNTNTATNTSVILFASSTSAANGSTNNVVKNCIIIGGGTTTGYAGILSCSGTTIGGAPSAAHNDNVFTNNTITKALNGIRLIGSSDNNTVITNNLIGSSIATDKIGQNGIRIFNQVGVNVSGNTIFGVTSSSTTITASGITVNGSMSGGSISKNLIYDVTHTNTSGYGCSGIGLYSTSTTNNVTIDNNVIYDVWGYGYSSGWAENDNGYGIMINAGGGYNIYHNSINLATNQTIAGNSAAINIAAGITNLNIRNNILANAQTTGTRYAIYSLSANSAFSNINYNNYYSAANTVGFLSSAQATLANWQSATSQDANSYAANPNFTANNNLLPVANAFPSNYRLGVQISGLSSTGYAGTTRSNPPDIGAYEGQDANRWIGATNTTWSTNSNWDNGSAATSNQNITIAANSLNNPALNADLIVNGIAINGTSTLSIGSNTLTINGAVSGTGTISGTSTSNLTLAGTAGNLNFTSGSRNINNLTLNTGASATLGTALNVYGKLGDVASGATLNLNGQAVALKAGTYPAVATVGQIAGTLSGATNVTTERSLPGGSSKKAYRQLASGVNSTGNISTNWQQGIFITGSTTGANGFDATQTGAPNMFTYTPGASSFTPIPNTNATTLNAKTGYRVFVMGDRTAGNLTVNPSPGIGQPNDAVSAATMVPATGTLLSGAQTYTGGELAANTNEYALIANPYWSPVDWDVVTKNNVATTYWLWDPSIGNRGAYTSWTTGTGASGGGNISNIIQPGQAIFVQTSSASPSITFNEANKTNSFTSTFRPSGLSPSKLVVKLEGAYGSNPIITKDATTMVFRDDFSTNILPSEDASKFINTDENIAIINNTTALGLEARPTVANYDIIPVRLWKLFDNNTYSLKLNAQDFDAGIQAYLRDKKLNTQTAINMSGETIYPFTFTTTDSSSFYNRFEIVFNNSTPLPANFTNIKAYRKNTGIQVEWGIAAETAIKSYEVQRSENADGFTTVATQTATANNGKAVNYDWFDANPYKTNNYYRIKVVGVNGEVKYSSVVKVGNSKETEKVSVYPNPLEGNVVTLQLGGIADGKYEIQLFSSIGQQMMSTSINKQGAVQTQTLTLPTNMSAGVYRLSIRAEDGTIYNRNIIKL